MLLPPRVYHGVYGKLSGGLIRPKLPPPLPKFSGAGVRPQLSGENFRGEITELLNHLWYAEHAELSLRPVAQDPARASADGQGRREGRHEPVVAGMRLGQDLTL